MRKLYLFLLLSGGIGLYSSQSVGINATTASPPAASAMMDVKANGNRKTVTLPQVFLASKTDQAVLNGGAATESLIIYNTNDAIPGGKGMYFWDSVKGEWQFVVSQGNIEIFKDLTTYATVKSNVATTVLSSSIGSQTGATGYTLNSNNTGWTMLPISAIAVAKQNVNFLEINFTGTWIKDGGGALNYSYDFAYGIFVDGQLKFVKTDSRLLPLTCSPSNFYVNAAIANISVGTNHTVTFGVQLRRIRDTNTSSPTIPNDLTLKIGGGGSGISCNNLNAFESQTRATIYVNQTL